MKKHLSLSHFVISKWIILIFILIACNLNSNSQNIEIKTPQITPVSPEAADIAKYASYPVDYSTGVPQITIPLYEIVSRDIILPITLSYHASGLKPKEESGWVGSGWTLNVVPSIVRTVNGIPDEELSNKTGLISNPNMNSYQKQYYRDWIDSGLFEEEPDQFTYKLANQSGSFYISSPYDFRDRYNPQIMQYAFQPHQPVKITSGVSSYMDAFQIIDDTGLSYLFGNQFGQDCTERSGDKITQWLCRSVQSPRTGAMLTFNYTSSVLGYVEDPFGLSDHVIIEDAWPNYPLHQGYVSMSTQTNKLKKYYSLPSYSDPVSISNPNGESYDSPARYTTNRIYKKKVQSISFDNGTVEFSQTGKNLQYINVKDKSGNIVRYFQFFVSKYNNETELTKLDSVRVFYGTKDIRTYRFEYDRPQYVHPMNTKSIDHWGYCNSYRPVSTSAVPKGRIEDLSDGTNTFEKTIGNGNRNSSEYYMKMGVLTDIYNPEGVHTRFTFEANRYGILVPADRKYRQHSTVTGGLRIKIIEDRDAKKNMVLSRRYFNYGYQYKNSLSSRNGEIFDGWGVPKHVPSIRDYCYTQYKIKINTTGMEKRSRVRTYGSYPVSNLTYNGGSSVLYNYVSEKKVVAGEPAQITKYYYDVPYWEIFSNVEVWDETELNDDIYDFYPQKRASSEAPYDVDNKTDHLYGQLTKVEKFGGDELISKTEYEYKPGTELLNPLPGGIDLNASYGIMVGKGYKKVMVIADPTNNTAREMEEYVVNRTKLIQGVRMLDKIRTTDYFENNKNVVKTQELSYSNQSMHMLPIKIKTSTSKGQINHTVEDYYMYPEDVPQGSSFGNSHSSLLANNCIKTLLEHKRITEGDIAITRAMYNGLNPQVIKEQTRTGAPFRDRLTFHAYSGGNVASVSTDGLSPVSYLWSYNRQYPIAKIENVNYTEVVTAMGGPTKIDQLANKVPTNQDFTSIDALRTSLPKAHITTYKHKPLFGVKEVKDPTGNISTFEYDNAGRLIQSKDVLNRKIAEYSYNLVGATGGSSLPPVTYYPLTANLDAYFEQLYSINTSLIFNVTTGGGSSNFTYSWTLKDLYENNDNILNSSSKDTYLSQSTAAGGRITLKFKKQGTYSLSCKVFDINTGDEVAASSYFYLRP